MANVIAEQGLGDVNPVTGVDVRVLRDVHL